MTVISMTAGDEHGFGEIFVRLICYANRAQRSRKWRPDYRLRIGLFTEMTSRVRMLPVIVDRALSANKRAYDEMTRRRLEHGSDTVFSTGEGDTLEAAMDECQLWTEMFYHFAWRVLVGTPGLPSISKRLPSRAKGVTAVRNQLIQHPRSHLDAGLLMSYGNPRARGPQIVRKLINPKSPSEQIELDVDKGLRANVKEMVDVMCEAIDRALDELDALPSSAPPTLMGRPPRWQPR